MVGASIKKTAELIGVARNTDLKVMTTFEEEGKNSPQKENSGRKRKLSDGDSQLRMRIVRKDHKKSAPQIIIEFNDYV